jgi:fibronectin-binding autotransporter adhesin
MDTLKVLILLLFCSIASAQVTPSIPNNSFLCNTAGLQAAPGPCTLGTNLAFSGSVLNAGGGAFNAISSGTNTTAAMLVGTGGSLGTSGSGTLSANQINGTALGGLATGILKNTTTTGVPSIATSADVIADFTGTCNSTTFLRADGSCQSAGSAAFNAITTGTNTATLTMGTGGTLTTSGTGIINADQVNGATVPASAAVMGSNSSSQITALTLLGNLFGTLTTLGTSQAVDPNNAGVCISTTYTVLASDAGSLLTFCKGSAEAVTLPIHSTTGFGPRFSIDTHNYGAGTVTFTPTTDTINNGQATLTETANTDCTLTLNSAGNWDLSACTAVFGGGGAGNFTVLAVSGASSLATGLTQAANTSVDGVTLIDSTAATSGNQQFSPSIRLTGQGWKTNATAASQPVDFIINNQPTQGTVNPTGCLVISHQYSGAGYQAALSLCDNGTLVSWGGLTVTGGGLGGQFINFNANYTVSGLPTCAAGLVNSFSAVTDQNGAPTYRGALTGGGTLRVPVFCGYNGTTYAWEAH